MYQNLTNATLANQLKEVASRFSVILGESLEAVKSGMGHDARKSIAEPSDLGQQLQGLNSWR
jgi:hypothetical protein